MITLPKALLDKYDDWLEREAVDANRHGEHRKWLRYYLDFCHKYGNGYLDELSLGLFAEKLQDKGQHPFQIEEASRAVRLYYRMAGETKDALPTPACEPERISKLPPATMKSEGASWVGELTRLREEIRKRTCLRILRIARNTISRNWISRWTQRRSPPLCGRS